MSGARKASLSPSGYGRLLSGSFKKISKILNSTVPVIFSFLLKILLRICYDKIQFFLIHTFLFFIQNLLLTYIIHFFKCKCFWTYIIFWSYSVPVPDPNDLFGSRSDQKGSDPAGSRTAKLIPPHLTLHLCLSG